MSDGRTTKGMSSLRAAQLTTAIVAVPVLVIVGLHGAFRSKGAGDAALDAQPQQQKQLEQAVAIVAPIPLPLLTKLPEFEELIAPPPDVDRLLEVWSPPYIAENELVFERGAAIQDADLRQKQSDVLWGSFYATHSRERLEEDAATQYARHQTESMQALLRSRRDIWFEINHVSFAVGNDDQGRFYVSPDELPASPIQLTTSVDWAVPVSFIDAVYSSFQTIIHKQAEAETDQFMGSENIQICREVPQGCTVPSYQEALKKIVANMRLQRIVLVGQGDMTAHRIDRLLLIDYDTGITLSNMDVAGISQLPKASYIWKTTSPFGFEKRMVKDFRGVYEQNQGLAPQ